MTNELIERYVLSIFEGEENIIDRRDGRLIISFDFRVIDEEKAKHVAETCLKELNKWGNKQWLEY